MEIPMPTALITAPPPPGPVRQFTVAEYHRLIQTGILTDEDKVELLNGYVVHKMPRNPSHDLSVMLAQELLRARIPAGWCVRGQCSVTLATSEPEPDVSIVRGSQRDYS